MLKTKIVSAVLCVAMTFTVGAAQAQSNKAALASLDGGEARAAIASAAPWAYMAPSGEAKGYLVDVTTAALKNIGVTKITPMLTTWDAMIPGLEAHRFDVIPAGLLITEARCKIVAFSDPITAQQDALYVLPDNPNKLTGFKQVAATPKIRLAVLTGSAQELYAIGQGISDEQLVHVPDIQAGIATVIGKRADAFAVGQFSVPNPGEKGVAVVVDEQTPVSSIAIAFRQQDVALRDEFNKQLADMRTSGAMKDLYATKYGFPNWETLAKKTKLADVVPNCESGQK